MADKKNARVILPNMLTLIGVCIGLTSIRFALDGKFEFAIIFQKTIRIEPGETPLSLSKKILTEEHVNYPVEIGKLLANGQ